MAECRLRSQFFKEKDINYTPGVYERMYSMETILEYAKYLITKNEPFSLAICVANDYKNLSKNYGNNACDKLLETISRVLLKSVSELGIIGKYGDDRFIVLLDGMNDYNDVWRVFHTINTTIVNESVEGVESTPAITSGISRFPIDGNTLEGLLQNNSKALVRGEEKGKACFIIYLAAKHANIVVHENKVTDFSTVEILSDIFEIVNNSSLVSDICNNLLKCLGKYLNPDHLCIQNQDTIISQYFGINSADKNISIMDLNNIKSKYDKKGLFFVNHRRGAYSPDDNALYNFYVNEGINSALVVDIICNGKSYGALRVEMVGNSHTWDSKDKVLYTTTAKLLATVINDRNQKL